MCNIDERRRTEGFVAIDSFLRDAKKKTRDLPGYLIPIHYKWEGCYGVSIVCIIYHFNVNCRTDFMHIETGSSIQRQLSFEYIPIEP